MKSRFTSAASVLFLLCMATTASAQLPTRGELVLKRYEEDRAKGLTKLNESFIATFRTELQNSMQSGRLEEANALKAKIEALLAENAELAKALAIAEKKAANPEKENLLVGKTVHFPHDRNESFTVRLVFLEGGKVNWIGLGNHKVGWNYEQGDSPLVFRAWMPGSSKDNGMVITIADPQATKATVRYGSSKTVEGVIRRSDRDEAAAP
ncbi:MAG TPA: hypothetical protein PLA50_04145 [Bacteroidia bacterium]|nr:hypothetical protein [Bacteroidia bacterium]